MNVHVFLTNMFSLFSNWPDLLCLLIVSVSLNTFRNIYVDILNTYIQRILHKFDDFKFKVWILDSILEYAFVWSLNVFFSNPVQDLMDLIQSNPSVLLIQVLFKDNKIL